MKGICEHCEVIYNYQIGFQKLFFFFFLIFHMYKRNQNGPPQKVHYYVLVANVHEIVLTRSALLLLQWTPVCVNSILMTTIYILA